MLKVDSQYITADGAGGYGESWLEKHWEAARQIIKSKETGDFILAIDEIQKIENWSETVKKLWDEDTVNQIRLKVIISGSSRLLLQKGLTESLAGRFEITYMGHWSYDRDGGCIRMECKSVRMVRGIPRICTAD